MIIYNSHTLPLSLSHVEWDIESFSNPNENEFDNSENILESNLPLEEEEQKENQKYEINFLDDEERHEQNILVDDEDSKKQVHEDMYKFVTVLSSYVQCNNETFGSESRGSNRPVSCNCFGRFKSWLFSCNRKQ